MISTRRTPTTFRRSPISAVIACCFAMSGSMPLRAQTVATPLTFAECLERQKELREEAHKAGSTAWDMVVKATGAFLTKASDAQYERAEELRRQADALKCIWHPETPTASEGDTPKKFGEAMRVLRDAAFSGRRPQLGDYLTHRAEEYAQEKLQGDVFIAPMSMQDIREGNVIRDMINDRFKELDEHNQALLNVLDRAGKDIEGVGVGNPERNGQVDDVVIDFPAMFNADYQAAESSRQGQADGLGRTSGDTTTPEASTGGAAGTAARSDQNMAISGSPPPVVRSTPPVRTVTLQCKMASNNQVCLDPSMDPQLGCLRQAIVNGRPTRLCGVWGYQGTINVAPPYAVRVPVR